MEDVSRTTDGRPIYWLNWKSLCINGDGLLGFKILGANQLQSKAYKFCVSVAYFCTCMIKHL